MSTLILTIYFKSGFVSVKDFKANIILKAESE